jgi:hypothetical protein
MPIGLLSYFSPRVSVREPGGVEAVPIHITGDANQSYPVMAAVTMDNRKLPLFGIVQGKTLRP